MPLPNPHEIVKHVIRLMGGHEKAWQTLDAEFQQAKDRWEQDLVTMGRILRAHLFVEHYIGEYIQTRNPELGSLEDARLTFAQKVALVGKATTVIADCLPGVRRLNSIRNRLAHTLRAEVTKEDSEAFLATEAFRALREESAKPNAPSTDPVDILEGFAMYAGNIFDACVSRTGEVFGEAIRIAQEEWSGTQAASPESP